MQTTKSSAFTLVELSIVLLIIGLIIGGITTGASLIKQAQIRSVINDFDKVTTALNTFKLQYQYYPGDFNNAYSIWTTGNCSSAAACNGNGNGNIDFSSPGANNDEGYLLWEHLSLANIVPGKFGATATASDQYQTKVPNGIFTVRNIGPWTTTAPVSNSIEFGAFDTTNATPSKYATNSILTVVDAYSIDLKVDDGIAFSGKLFGIDGLESASAKCSYLSSVTTVPATNYTFANTGTVCRLQKAL